MFQDGYKEIRPFANLDEFTIFFFTMFPISAIIENIVSIFSCCDHNNSIGPGLWLDSIIRLDKHAGHVMRSRPDMENLLAPLFQRVSCRLKYSCGWKKKDHDAIFVLRMDSLVLTHLHLKQSHIFVTDCNAFHIQHFVHCIFIPCN